MEVEEEDTAHVARDHQAGHTWNVTPCSMEKDTAHDAAPSARASGVTHVRENRREYSTYQESSTRRVRRRVGGCVGGCTRGCVRVLCIHTHCVSTARMQSLGHQDTCHVTPT